MYIGKEVKLSLFEDWSKYVENHSEFSKILLGKPAYYQEHKIKGQYKTECILVATKNSELKIMVLQFTVASKYE